MARIAGVDLPAKKRAEIGLTYIYGIGKTRSASILYHTGVDKNKKISDLSEDEVNKIRTMIENDGSVEGDLRKEISMNIKRLIEMGSYRGREMPSSRESHDTDFRRIKLPLFRIGSHGANGLLSIQQRHRMPTSR